ncbi:hypothetical protein ACIQU6_15105 [Streptomyces sp. NPDC090442]|uniref:hypothetical protein n=1 Tax=Streptomyces sp. NPDC090442 TaxID=3365962 RepID=UPI0038234EBC
MPTSHPARRRKVRLLAPMTAALTCTLTAGALAGCGSHGGTGAGSASRTTSSPVTATPSGTPPSVSASASEFEASVSAETARAAAASQKALKNVSGRGNALNEVGMTGIARAKTGGVLAVHVPIVNKTDHVASYAAQIDFVDAKGHVVETRYVGAEDLKPGQRVQPIAFSRQPPEPKLTARLAKAQRY